MSRKSPLIAVPAYSSLIGPIHLFQTEFMMIPVSCQRLTTKQSIPQHCVGVLTAIGEKRARYLPGAGTSAFDPSVQVFTELPKVKAQQAAATVPTIPARAQSFCAVAVSLHAQIIAALSPKLPLLLMDLIVALAADKCPF
ncbi:hypothetical protein MHYP_G00072780 [Metynnis hypsauchen]